MKRLSLHIAFWLVYLLQDALLQFVWVAPVVSQIPERTQLLMALEAALLALIPKLLFTWFILYFVIDKILNEDSRIFRVVLQIVLAMAVSVAIYRVIFNYTIPWIYKGVLHQKTLFNIQSILLAIMDIGFVSGVAIAMKLLRMQLGGKDREKNLLRDKLEAELKFLRHQTNPHFLFNTLNNIYALARKKSDNTAEVVMKLSKLLRFMLYESKNDLITISEELKILDDYLELERIRYSERLTIIFNKAIDDEQQKIAPLLLLPFIENAFKHGASESRFDSFIHIDIRLQQGSLTFGIENTKENGNATEVVDNIGLGNVRRQLELMYKEYDLTVENQNNLFRVQLVLNLNSHAKIQLHNSRR